MIRDKRGFLRIIEASIAIIAIISVLFLFYNQPQQTQAPDYTMRAHEILSEIARDTTFRNQIISYDTANPTPPPIPASIDTNVAARIPEGFLSYELRICDIADVCGQSTFVGGDVFSSERVVSSTLTTFQPKKVKLFIWRN